MLYLLPNLLHEEAQPGETFSPRVQEIVFSLDGIIAESERGARLFLRNFVQRSDPLSQRIHIALLNEHTTQDELEAIVRSLRDQKWGLISDSGLPIIADPGCNLVFLARRRGIAVEALSGPSSLLMALQLSGLPAQRFSFHGYLEREKERLQPQIKKLELQSKQEKRTQLFIEAPYRNEKLFQALAESLDPSSWLSVAVDLMAPAQFVKTLEVKEWRKQSSPALHKKETLFLFYAADLR